MFPYYIIDIKAICMLINKYKLKRKIAKGSFGKIYMALDIETNAFVIIKKIYKTEKNVGRIKNDAEIPKLINHMNVIKILDYFEFRDFAYIVYPFIKDSREMSQFEADLIFQNNGKFKKIINIFRQLCDVIDFMHTSGVVHRDLKPENILLIDNDSVPIILDFDLAFVIDNENYPSYDKICGSPGYLAPEMWKEYDDYSFLNYKSSDIYSFGVMLYRICNSGKMPYDTSSFEKLYFSILNDSPIQSDCGIPEMDNLIMKLINRNPENRPLIEEIRSILEKIK